MYTKRAAQGIAECENAIKTQKPGTAPSVLHACHDWRWIETWLGLKPKLTSAGIKDVSPIELGKTVADYATSRPIL
jgi:hypothetical protein